MAGDTSELGFGCVADPYSFDCPPCDSLVVRNCRLRKDESLRDYELTRRWRWLTPSNVSPTDLAVAAAACAVREAHSFAVQQGIAIPAALAHRSLRPETQGQVTEASLEAMMLISPAFIQTSPRVFRAVVGQAPSGLPLPIVPTPGIHLEALATAATPLGRDQQVRLFKRLVALSAASAHADRMAGLQALERVVQADLQYVMTTEKWTLGEIHRAASSSDHPSVRGVADERRYRLLASVLATELLAGRGPGDLMAERQALRDTLELANMRLVINIARAHTWTQFLLFSDLAQEAFIGLRRAVERFDPYRGFAFSTYATPWIKQAVRRYIANTDRTIRLPVHVVDKLPELRAIRSSAARAGSSQSGGDSPGLVVAALAADDPGVSWERLRAQEFRVGAVRRELIYVVDYAESADEQVVAGRLMAAVAELPPRERRVIELRHGLLDNRFRTLEEVGREFNLTRERIRQVESKAFKRLSAQRRVIEGSSGRATEPEVATRVEGPLRRRRRRSVKATPRMAVKQSSHKGPASDKGPASERRTPDRRWAGIIEVATSDWKSVVDAARPLAPTPHAQVPMLVRRIGVALEAGRGDALLSVTLDGLRKRAFPLALEAVGGLRPNSQDFALAVAAYLASRTSWGTISDDDVSGWEATLLRHQESWWGRDRALAHIGIYHLLHGHATAALATWRRTPTRSVEVDRALAALARELGERGGRWRENAERIVGSIEDPRVRDEASRFMVG